MGLNSTINNGVQNYRFAPWIGTGAIALRPPGAADGALWIDSSAAPRPIYQYDIVTASWVQVGGGGGGIGGTVSAPRMTKATAPDTIGDSSLLNYPTGGYPNDIVLANETTFEISATPTVANGNFIGYVTRKQSNSKVVAIGLGRENVMGEIFTWYSEENFLFKSFNGSTNFRSVLFNNGRWSINKTTDEGFQFDINGNLRASQYFTNDVNVIINGGNTFTGRFIPNGQNAVVIGAFSMISATSPGSSIAIGYGNGMSITTGAYNTFIGRNAGRGMTTGEYNMLIVQSDAVNLPNLIDCIHLLPHGYEDNDAARCVGGEVSKHILIGGGFNFGSYVRKLFLGGGIFVTRPDQAHFDIYAPSGVGANLIGSNLTFNAGRGTGSGAPGDLIFSTSTTTAPGSATQVLQNRWYIKGNTGTLSDTGASSASASIYLADKTKALKFVEVTTAEKLAIVAPEKGYTVFDTTLDRLSTYTSLGWN